MKSCSILILLFAATTVNAAEPFTNQLAIYLLADRAAWVSNRTTNPRGLSLATKPLVCDADFVTYDITNMTFTTTADAARRLNVLFNTNDLSTPFVLVASREPIFVGVFESPFSSYMYFDFPVIQPDQFLNFGNTTFRYQIRGMHRTGTNTFVLKPQTELLNDPRIISAVQKLFPHD